ncbi:oxidoreductase [Lysobacter enzymogenes]|uniref:Oxidoreductase n=1 Tax=Lysobacter enzymogenes TaxID=69 RepID=A0A0S2DBI5_LYSEN|nr:GNAT family N-acetyltransferase [Lysobacter enzymogenes]ALN55886.1 oxidoreductase [Lysobacter enzymogenes]QCW24853.1 GNAT family N-acetyltransferase [Lysobacter enzymogenes]
MKPRIEVFDSLERVDRRSYQTLHDASRASLFYDWRFLLAAERSPLLPTQKTLYLCAYDGDELAGCLPAYLQRLAAVDPLGLLARAAQVRDAGGESGLFSHMMHCWDSSVPCLETAGGVREALLDALLDVAAREGAAYAGLLNLGEAARAGGSRLRLHPLVERYDAQLGLFDDFDHYVRALPSDGRAEMRRQLRKFEASGASAQVLAPPFDDRLEQVCELCFRTTARRGTPHYFPAAPLARFVRLCGDLARLVLIQAQGRVISGMIGWQRRDTFCLWSAGVTYDQSDFSPYTICFAAAFRHAFAHGLQRFEGGRLNERIKRRLGLSPVPLRCAIARLAPPRRAAPTSARVPASAALD